MQTTGTTVVVSREHLEALATLLESGDAKVIIDKVDALSETPTAVAHMRGHRARGQVVIAT